MLNTFNIADHKDTPIRPAATVLLLRDSDEGLQTLLLRRNKALKFAGGAWVFPGGSIDKVEIERSDNLEEAARLAAVREAKEESGLVVEASELVYYGHWTPPPVVPKRFATWFFAAPISRAGGQSPESVEVDGGEIHDFRWLSPNQALMQHRAGDLPILPPTYISLRMLKPFSTVNDAMVSLRAMEPYEVIPNTLLRDKKIISLYPGDAGYMTREPDLPGERHRLVETDHGYVYEHSGAGVDMAPMDQV